MAVSVKIFFSLFVGILLLACGNENPSGNDAENSSVEKCKYGSPTPIFSKELEKVVDHSFSVNGQKGLEKVKFENGMELELIQDGCNELLQSFQFSFNSDLTGEDRFWVEQAAEQFRYLSTLSEDHLSFSLWAGAIANNIESINLGTAFEPEPNTFIKIDKVPSGEKTILVVTLEAKG